MEKDAVPYFCTEGKFSPICGHGFWNNRYGADAFCQALGFTGGTLSKDGRKIRKKKQGIYEQDAFMIGTCKSLDAIDKCAGGHNTYSFVPNCRVGNNVKVFVTCDGNTLGSALICGSGKIEKL